MTQGRAPRRGEVWSCRGGWTGLVLSIDSFNDSDMRDVICLNVVDGDQADEDETPYAAVVSVEVGGEVVERTVFFDDIYLQPKVDMLEPLWKVPKELLDEVRDALEEIISALGAMSPTPA